MCFGEIDIRTQSIKQAIRLSITINESVEIIANSLIDFCKYIYKKYNIKIFIWNPVATSSPHFLAYNHLYPTVGTEIERNFATEYFSKYTNNSTNSIRSTLNYEIYSFGIYDKLSSFYQTKIEYFEDGCHLNNRGFDLAVESFIEVSTLHNLPNPIDYFSDVDIFNEKYQSREITKYVKLSLSSLAENIAQISRHKSGYCFHTNFEKNPHAIIDIEYAANLDKIIIFNRENLYLERASKLQVYAGLILSNLKKIYEIDRVWGENNIPIVIIFDKNSMPCRYIVIRLNDENYLHLGEIKLYEKSFLK